MAFVMWRPRSWKARLTATVTLVAMLSGPVGASSAPAMQAPASSPAKPAAAVASKPGKLPTDTPWVLPTRLVPARIAVLSSSPDPGAVGLVFDERAGTGLVAGAGPTRFRVDLEAPSFIDAVAVWGKVDGALSIETSGPKGTAEIMARAALATGGAGWNRREVAAPPLATSVTVTFESARGAMLRELEIWGRPASAPESSHALLPDALYSSLPGGAREHAAAPTEQTIGLATVSGPGRGGMFTVKVDVDPGDVARAFLVYELSGLPHFAAAVRSVNGRRALGRFGVSRGAKGGLQVEEIDPASLLSGANKIQFQPADDHDPGSYRVRSLRIVTVRRTGAVLSDAGARAWEAVRDGREATGWKAAPGKPVAERRWSFANDTQPWALDVRLPQRGAGTLTVASRDEGNTGEMVVKLDGLAAGWHRVPLDRLPRTRALVLKLAAAKEQPAEISELAIEGSPLPGDEAPSVAVTYPLSGECVNGRVHVRGFVTPAGADSLAANGARQAAALDRDGTFAFEMNGKEVAGRDIVVEATYPGGKRARETVSIGRCVDRPPVVVADDGRPRQPVDDAGAPFGVTVRAGQAAALAFDGVKLDIPEGAVDKDVRITIRPLPTKDVAPLDPAMTNVTPSGKSFRFGPLGMLFKKPVKLTVPYSSKLIPAGMSEKDVRTFYYDETLHRWEQVAIVNQNDGQMVVVSDHFTDFINATIPMPDHPGTQSMNPTSLKGIKLADPAAGITQIEPPAGNSSGLAALQFPLDTPPGRRGVQPALAIAYNSAGRNSWLGVGWDLHLSEIQVDTRFGVPKYNGSETYVLDGAMLTPIAPPLGAPVGGQYFARRLEGAFDWIQRTGTNAADYTWVVTDKNGVKAYYGEASASRLADPALANRSIFRWSLSRIRDPFGNELKVTYQTDAGANPEAFVQLYPSSIDYTSNATAGLAAAYRVDFVRGGPLGSSCDRPDQIIDGRPGFQELTRCLLKEVNVRLGAQLIRQYKLWYQTPSAANFHKSLLTAIEVRGPDAQAVFHRHDFTYFSTPVEQSPNVKDKLGVFQPPVAWATVVNKDGTARVADGLSRDVERVTATDAHVGIGVPGFVSLEFGASDTAINGAVPWRMLDFNSDSLLDAVGSDGLLDVGGLVGGGDRSRVDLFSGLFTPQQTANFGGEYPPGGGGGWRAGRLSLPLSTVNRNIINLRGGLVGLATLQGNFDVVNTARENVTLADMNGDGFVDHVIPSSSGLMVRLNDGNNFLKPAVPWNNYAISKTTCSLQNLIGPYTRIAGDLIGRITAPVTGVLSVAGDIAKGAAGSGENVLVSIYHGVTSLFSSGGADGGSPPEDLELVWSKVIHKDDPPCNPGPNNSCSSGLTIPVEAGDRVFFRVSALDAPGEVINWDPQLTYQSVNSVALTAAQKNLREPEGAFIHRFSQAGDFRTVGRTFVPWLADSHGVVAIEGQVVKNATSDDVRIRIVQEHADGTEPTVRLSQTLAGNAQATLPTVLGGVSVQAGDKLSFEVLSDLPIDPDRVSWEPIVTYQNYCRLNPDTGALVCGDVQCFETPAVCEMAGDPQPSFPVPTGILKKRATVFYPSFRFQPGAATTTFVTTASGPATITGTFAKTSATPGRVVAAIQGVNGLYLKRVFEPNQTGTFPMAVTTPALQAGAQLFFTVYSDTDVSGATSWAPVVEGAARPLNRKVRADGMTPDESGYGVVDVMGGGYHGWSYGDWNGSKPLRESQIAFDPASPLHDFFPMLITPRPLPTVEDPDGTAQFGLNPIDLVTGAKNYGGRALGAIDQAVFGGTGGRTFRAAVAGGTWLVGVFTNGLESLFCETEHPVRITDSGNFGVTVGVIATGNFNSGSSDTTVELIDMNGDRYPDSVTGAGIRFNTGTGFEPTVSPGLPLASHPRHIENRADGIQIGSGSLVTLTDGAGNPIGFFGGGAGLTYGVSRTTKDLIDMNGDGLPDHVRSDGAGQLLVRLNFGYRFGAERLWTTEATTWGESQVGADPELDKQFRNDLKTDAIRVTDTSANNGGLGGAVAGSGWRLGLSGSKSNTLVRHLVDMIDVNGDGLPDKLMRKPGLECGGSTSPSNACLRVNLNLGNGFDSERQIPIENWPAGALTGLPGGLSGIGLARPEDALSYMFGEGSSGSVGGDVPVAPPIYVGGGQSWGSSDNTTMQSFEDVDGDGTLDQVRKATGNALAYARLNTTGKTNLLKHVSRPLGGGIDLDYSREGNQPGFSIGLDNPKNQWVLSKASVDDGRGNRYTNTFDYSVGGPGATPRLSSGNYDRTEREDYGYARVTMTRGIRQANGSYLEGDGSRSDRFFENHSFYLRGLPRGDFESNANGAVFNGALYVYARPSPSVPARTGRFFPAETIRSTLLYEKRAVSLGQALLTRDTQTPTGLAPKYKIERRGYDTEGNLTSLVDEGDEQLATDDLRFDIQYSNEANTHITRAFSVTATQVSNAAMLRKRTATFDAGKGTPRTLTNIISGGKVPGSGTPGSVYNQASAIYTLEHDGFGNLQTYTDPTGYKLKYTYDTTAQTYPTRVDDLSFGYFSTAGYDLRFGAVQSSTDANGHPQSFAYDAFGRLCTVHGPDDQSATEPTIAMSYSVVRTSCPNPPAAGALFPAYAMTRHKDVQHAADPIDTVTFIDGLGRVIQTKKDIDHDLHADGRIVQTGMTVSGQIVFDTRGRVSAQGHPIFDGLSAPTQFAIVPMQNPTLSGYDELGRQTVSNVPDGTPDGIQIETAHAIILPNAANTLGDGRTWLLTTLTDPRDNAHYTYADTRGNTIAVRELNEIGASTTLTPLTTKYGYDPIDQLLTVTDATQKVTSAAYDTMGRMVSLTSPDAGQTEHRFDLNGNLKEKQTPVLRAAAQMVKYEYDFNRLKKVDYPTSTDVVYTYGLSTERGDSAGNIAGRLKQVVHESGNETRTYDRLGNVNKTVATLNRMSTATGLPPTLAFTMKYTYDWLGRMQTMTFPNWINQSFQILSGEGERVSYFYDRGGNIDRITGAHQTPNPQQTSHPTNYVYLDHAGYDEFSQRRVLVSGNGIANVYSYEPASRRLAAISASSRGLLEQQQNRPPTPFHRLSYQYDKVGNVTHMTNNVSVRPHLNAGVFVGPLDVSYTYDSLNQLRSMSSKYRPHVAYGYQYSDTFTFDEIGNIATKAQSHDRLVWDNQTVNTTDTDPVVTQLAGSRFDHNTAGLTYSLAYQYTGSRPHAASTITETPAGSAPATRTYSYDTNGNNRGHTFQLNNREQIWDEDNRLKEVKLNGGTVAQFRYDDSGERTKKHIPGSNVGDSWYVNQFFVLLPGNRPTKHIFVGDMRIATKTDSIWLQTPVLHHYHSDHLGTTGYITDKDQNLVQHERYFAYGELWRGGGPQEETDLSRPNGDRREWLFTGKEWDVDSKLYYFGARYFDPHTSVWQSTDPILGSYMRGGPSGGVFQPRNLGLYSYAWNNPVVMRDPTGLSAQCGAPGPCDSKQVAHQQQTSYQALLPGAIREGVQKFKNDPVRAAIFGTLKASGRGSSERDVQDVLMTLIDRNAYGTQMSQSSAELADLELKIAGNAIFLLAGGIAGEIGVGGGAAGLALESGAGGGIARAQIFRTIGPGEKVADIIAEGKALTYATGNEHALISLTNGQRMIVSGGPGGIDLRGMAVRRVLGHSHPYQLPATGPSAVDFQSLIDLKQSSSWLLEHGQLTRFRVRQ